MSSRREREPWIAFLDRLRALVAVELAALVVPGAAAGEILVRCDGDAADEERLRGVVARWVARHGRAADEVGSVADEGALRLHLVALPAGAPDLAIVIGTPRRGFPSPVELALMDHAVRDLSPS